MSLTAQNRQIQFAKNTEFAVQIASTDLDSTTRFPADTDIYFTVVGVMMPVLRNMLSLKTSNSVVDTILSGSAGFLYYERMGPDMQKTLRELSDAQPANSLSTLFYRIRIQQLVYLLFEKLLRRDSERHTPINKADASKLLAVRSSLLADLSQPPKLPDLAQRVGMSETKLSDLFRQVFGDSVYHYYQRARLDEAAFLLRHQGLSVAEVGYRLGFSNLSHFTRQFEKHIGTKPKRYSVGE